MIEQNTLQIISSSEKIGRHVVLVHGTWGHGLWHSILWDYLPPGLRHRDINWPICRKIKEAGVTLHSFTWSGKNSHHRRMEGGKELAVFIASLSKDPSDRMWVVGHSHGGNVALYSLKHPGTEAVDGIVCLATPFLHFGPQEFDLRVFRSLSIPIWFTVVSIAFVLGWGLLNVTYPEVIARQPHVVVSIDLVVASVIGLCGVLGLRGILSRIDSLLNRLPAICESYQPPAPEPERLLILRKVGDEASAALATGRFLEWLVSSVWSGFSRLAVPFIAALKILTQPIPRSAPIAIALLFVMALLTTVTALSAPFREALAALLSYGLFGTVIALMSISLLQLVLLCSILGLSIVRFGHAKGLGATSLIRVTTEAIPHGLWQVELFSASGFAHGDIHEDPSVGERVAMWFLKGGGGGRR